MRNTIVSIEHETLAKEKYLADVTGRCELFDGRVVAAKATLAETEKATKEAKDAFAKERDEMNVYRTELAKRETAVSAVEKELNERNEHLLASMIETARAKEEAEKVKQTYTDKISKIKEIIG